MEKIKASAPLAQKERAAGRSGKLEFDGRANTVKPRPWKHITLTLLPREKAENHDLDGNLVDDTCTGVTTWFGAPQQAGTAEVIQ
ncbi:hypothetical protein OG705_29120 [Streptomyces sp. NBC_00838]|uniref:hypothetical protein n=1 Tax=Streptomyces sp. NBC_00838 TaxID=2903680 RepID=UPI00386FA74D|nr:hypothetical protein OG705_29120 [Streptomyces sp. NBC_00838]